MRLLARLRFIVARRPYLYWLVAGSCALLVAARVHGLETAAEHSAARWGATRTVWVSSGDVGAGGALNPIERHFPAAMVPTAAVATVPPHAHAARAVAAGQVLLAADLQGFRTPPVDWVALAMPAEHAPRLSAGDSVVVLRGGAAVCDGMAVEARGDRVEVAVPVSCAAAVSADISTLVVARRTTPTYGASDDRP